MKYPGLYSVCERYYLSVVWTFIEYLLFGLVMLILFNICSSTAALNVFDLCLLTKQLGSDRFWGNGLLFHVNWRNQTLLFILKSFVIDYYHS